MKSITYISFLFLILCATQIRAQLQIGRQVIGSSGGSSTTSNLMVSSTIGEVNITTQNSSNLIITQGFQQTYNNGDSIVTFIVKNESCAGANNGSISITNLIGCASPYQVNITSINNSNLVLSNGSLATGEYTADIEGINGCSYSFDFFIGLDSDENCQLKFYSGITPNGDGQNDLWNIDNIELFPENEVGIYTRWGEEVWFKKGYDNLSVVWDGTGNNGELINATYFYVVTVGNNKYRGWIELTR